MVQSKGFRVFILIMGALILVFGTIAGIKIHDRSTLTMLPIFGILYILYVVMCIRQRKQEKETPKQKEQRSPLLPK